MLQAVRLVSVPHAATPSGEPWPPCKPSPPLAVVERTDPALELSLRHVLWPHTMPATGEHCGGDDAVTRSATEQACALIAEGTAPALVRLSVAAKAWNRLMPGWPLQVAASCSLVGNDQGWACNVPLIRVDEARGRGVGVLSKPAHDARACGMAVHNAIAVNLPPRLIGICVTRPCECRYERERLVRAAPKMPRRHNDAHAQAAGGTLCRCVHARALPSHRGMLLPAAPGFRSAEVSRSGPQRRRLKS